MGISTHAIQALASAASLPYATVERHTRPLKPARRWVDRAHPHLRADHCASLIESFAADEPSGALEAAILAENLVSADPFLESPFGSEVPCAREDATFPGNMGDSLHDYLVSGIVQLAATPLNKARERAQRA